MLPDTRAFVQRLSPTAKFKCRNARCRVRSFKKHLRGVKRTKRNEDEGKQKIKWEAGREGGGGNAILKRNEARSDATGRVNVGTHARWIHSQRRWRCGMETSPGNRIRNRIRGGIQHPVGKTPPSPSPLPRPATFESITASGLSGGSPVLPRTAASPAQSELIKCPAEIRTMIRGGVCACARAREGGGSSEACWDPTDDGDPRGRIPGWRILPPLRPSVWRPDDRVARSSDCAA